MIESNIQGIPCLINVTVFEQIAGVGSMHTAPSDVDYYGYTEMEYEVCDRRGRKAEWLERKMTELDKERIEQDILDYYAED